MGASGVFFLHFNKNCPDDGLDKKYWGVELWIEFYCYLCITGGVTRSVVVGPVSKMFFPLKGNCKTRMYRYRYRHYSHA